MVLYNNTGMTIKNIVVKFTRIQLQTLFFKFSQFLGINITNFFNSINYLIILQYYKALFR